MTPLNRLARAAGFPVKGQCKCGSPLVGAGTKCRACAEKAWKRFRDRYK